MFLFLHKYLDDLNRFGIYLIWRLSQHFKEPAAFSELFPYLYWRGELPSSGGATSACPRPTSLGQSQPLWTWKTVRLLSLRVMQPSPCLRSQTCLRARMAPYQLRTRVRSRPWRRATPLTADTTCGWSSKVPSGRAYPRQWTYWNPPYTSQMWFPVPKKHPWTHSLTMVPTETQTTRRDIGRSSREGELKDLSCLQAAALVCFQDLKKIQTSRVRRLFFCR